MSGELQTSPPGVTPRRLHEAGRMRHIILAIRQYSQAGKPVPVEWMDELIELLGWEKPL